MRAWIVIPARLASTRLPRKLLLRETGKSLIHHTYEAAQRAKVPLGITVATDAEEILREVQSFGGSAEMTSVDCASGTDRVAEIARRHPEIDVFVNVQGDEPDLSGETIDLAVQLLQQQPQTPMATLATPIRSRDKLVDPACVKVVCDAHGRALYFSRSMIPFAREWHDSLLTAEPPLFLQHLGLYAYRRDFLLRLANLPPAPLEQTEKLEQLRVLQAGYPIAVGVVAEPSIGIDTPDDYRQFVASYRQRVAA